MSFLSNSVEFVNTSPILPSYQSMERVNVAISSDNSIPELDFVNVDAERIIPKLSQTNDTNLKKKQFKYVENSIIGATVIAVAGFILSRMSKKTNYHSYAFGSITLILAHAYKNLQDIKKKL